MSHRHAIPARIAQWQHSQGCLLTFHRAAREDIWSTLPNRDFYIHLGFLDRLLGYLVHNGWKAVTLDEIACTLETGEDGSRLVNFSVDDCYRDTFEYVVPLFRKHGVPVTLFVTTGIPDRTLALGRAGLESIIARQDRIALKGDKIDVSGPSAKRHWFERIVSDWEKSDFDREYEEFCTLNDVDSFKLNDDHAITWGMLETFRGDPLVEIGAHTESHPKISALSADAAWRELAGSRARLRSRLGVPCRHFAFPYGRSGDCGARDFNLARKAGFASAATTRRGILKRDQDLFCLPRNTLNGAHRSIAYVEAKMSGLTAIAARMLNCV